MKTIKASEFKARCLKLMDEGAASGEPFIMTKNGKPIAQLVPSRPKPSTLFDTLKGTLRMKGDFLEPLDMAWEAQRKDKTVDAAFQLDDNVYLR